jgi:pyruvate/2-oxoglutarate dehydrogenase complex dihydrolipoamide acyltransferase (E2) component
MSEILIPDIGNFDSVDVIEILVKPGDKVNKDDPLITLESDKASMDIPATESGIIKEIKVNVGDKVKEGIAIATFESAQRRKEGRVKTSCEKRSY